VDQGGLDVGARTRLLEGGHLLAGVLARPPRPGILVEELDRAGGALGAAPDRVRRPPGRRDMGAN
jgi:hypothetical protein